MISTCERPMEHLFAGQNTQHVTIHRILNVIHLDYNKPLKPCYERPKYNKTKTINPNWTPTGHGLKIFKKLKVER